MNSNNFLIWLKEIAPNSRNFFSFSKHDPTIKSIENSLLKINKKIWEKTNKKEKSISFESYEKYFSTLKSLGLWEDFEIITTNDNLIIKGSVIKSPLINDNNEKTIIFCHGITNNRWSLFYCIHLVLQMGYQVVIYDARNHGMSQTSYNTLGKIESLDLEDVVNWVNRKYNPEKLGFYGFSMGSATLLFWIGQFQDFHPEVSFVICESPLDDFKERFRNFLNIKEENSLGVVEEWKHYLLYNIASKVLKSPINLLDVSPILSLPKKLKLKLLLLHGVEDTVIPWQSSLKIWEKLNENKENIGLVNLYLFDNSDHDELVFFGDFFPNNLRWIKNKENPSKFCFSSLIFSFLSKNF
ncbi:MAG: Putative aminoacrylate hydrolase RutD [Mycoplasmataceae bacterium]|nr:MAG: Putative aminoacrylate hydrolase RutD [Mycoplasmataceae bacterium]